MNEMTLPFRYRIRNSSQGGLRPSTLPLGHGGSQQYWISTIERGKPFCFFETWRTEWGSNPRSPTFQASSFNQGAHPIWGLANQVFHVFTIIILTFWWLEFRMSRILTLCVVDYHLTRVSHISSINRLGLDCQMSLILTFWWLKYHISHALTWWLSHQLSYALTLWRLE